MDATENADVALVEIHEVKKESRKSRKRKMKLALSAEQNLETDSEKFSGAVQEVELVLKSCPAVNDDLIASEDKSIDLDMTGDVLASGNIHVEKKGANRKKRAKKDKNVSVAAVSENILGTEGDNMGSQAPNNEIEQITGNKTHEKTGMHIDDLSGSQEGALPKCSPLSGDGISILKDTINQEAAENQSTAHVGENIGKLEIVLDKKQNVVCADQCVTASEVSVLKVKKPSAGERRRSKKKCKLFSVSELGLNSEDGEKDRNEESNTNSVNDGESKDSREGKNVSPGEGIPLKAFRSEVAVLEVENSDTCKAKRKKMKPQLSSVSQSDLNGEDGEKDINMVSSSVSDVDSKHSREENNVAPVEGIPLKAFRSEVAVLEVENPDTCKKKRKKMKPQLSSKSQSDLNCEDGEKDGIMVSSSVNDGDYKLSRGENNVVPGEGIHLTAPMSSSVSIKDVCGPLSSGEAIHDKILLCSPKIQCVRLPSRKLLILDINGLLADIIAPVPFGYKPDLMLSRKAVFKRPFCESFLNFCFEKFDVGVWSSRVKINVDNVLNYLMGEMKNKLVFYWDRSHCTITGFPTIENRDKPLVLKELSKLWDDHQFHLGKYDKTNTLLLDDSPYKALCNPADTAIFPLSYQYKDVNDCSLGPGGDLRSYLERLSMADNIPEFVRNNPFGQRAIKDTNLSWNYYKNVIDSRKSLIKRYG